MNLKIEVEDPGQPDIIALLELHLAHMRELSPPESVHALDLESLRAPGITFFAAREDGKLLAYGALKELDRKHAELKSMHTLASARGKGIAKLMLNTIAQEAIRRRYKRISLETGSMEAFRPARSLYENYGFKTCLPFAQYRHDPNSTYMTKEI